MKEFNTKKKFGQNFLKDENLLAAICSDAKIESDDTVLEIGAGMGALTKHLSKNAKKVISFEIDNDLQEILLNKQYNNVEFVFQDILKADVAELENKIDCEYKMVANLPYYITSPIIFKFLKSKNLKSMTVMVQKEVGERIIAKENCKDYGVLSVCLNAFADCKITRIVGRNMFSPVPNVDSCIVNINLCDKFEIDDSEKFFEFVKMIFSMRRKTLLNNLLQSGKFNKQQLVEILDEGILARRSETFSVEEIVNLFNNLILMMR